MASPGRDVHLSNAGEAAWDDARPQPARREVPVAVTATECGRARCPRPLQRILGKSPAGHRSGEQEALRDVATDSWSARKTSRVSMPSATSAESEVVAEVDDCPHDRGVTRVLEHVRHEAHVDLELIDRQRRQVTQRRLTGPEVVEADLHAEGVELRQRERGPDRIGEQRRLGDLDRQAIGRDPDLWMVRTTRSVKSIG